MKLFDVFRKIFVWTKVVWTAFMVHKLYIPFLPKFDDWIVDLVSLIHSYEPILFNEYLND